MSDALMAEAKEDQVSFKYDGETYTIDRELDYDVLEALEEGRLSAAVKGMLGDSQHDAFKAKKRKLRHAGELLKAATDALGVDPGK